MNLEKILQIEFKSVSRPELVFKKKTEKWLSGREPTPREERITRMRAQLRARAKRGIEPDFEQMILLIREEQAAGYFKLVNDRCQYLLTRSIFTDEQKAAVWNRMGLAKTQLFGQPHGLEAYIKATQLHPDQWVYHYNVGVTHLWSTHRFDEAEKALEIAARFCTYDMEVHYQYGEALAKNGKSSESKESFSRAFDFAKQAFEKRPLDPDARLYFRRCCDKLGLEYPEDLKNALLDPEPQDIDNMRPSSLDQGDIVRSERASE